MSEQVKAALVIAVSLIAATVGCGGSSSSAPTSPTVTTAPAIPKANLVVVESGWYDSGYLGGKRYQLVGVIKNQGPGCASDITWRVEYFGTSGNTPNVLILEGDEISLDNVNILQPNVSAEFRSYLYYSSFKNRVTSTDVKVSWTDVACP
jgi:hypothetical protein